MDISTLIPKLPPVPEDQKDKDRLAEELYDRASAPGLDPAVAAQLCTLAVNLKNPVVITETDLAAIKARANVMESETEAAWIAAGIPI